MPGASAKGIEWVSSFDERASPGLTQRTKEMLTSSLLRTQLHTLSSPSLAETPSTSPAKTPDMWEKHNILKAPMVESYHVSAQDSEADNNYNSSDSGCRRTLAHERLSYSMHQRIHVDNMANTRSQAPNKPVFHMPKAIQRGSALRQCT
ncbi:hypothetical protein BP5796_02227 [Coleophoma crateriformis]|uniref:Uncharacterized protein n=1 Tax=Coleophoma crateriformis TaxID=565419 RepID=A0A3D8SXL0_9HELO|nr:hypothetical protein BP5796_02227 [Coleophoma crateriformis]